MMKVTLMWGRHDDVSERLLKKIRERPYYYNELLCLGAEPENRYYCLIEDEDDVRVYELYPVQIQEVK